MGFWDGISNPDYHQGPAVNPIHLELLIKTLMIINHYLQVKVHVESAMEVELYMSVDRAPQVFK